MESHGSHCCDEHHPLWFFSIFASMEHPLRQWHPHLASHHVVHATLSSTVLYSKPHEYLGLTNSYFFSGLRGYSLSLSLHMRTHTHTHTSLGAVSGSNFAFDIPSSYAWCSHAVVVQGTPGRLSPCSSHFFHGLQKLKCKRRTLMCISSLHLCSDSPNVCVCVCVIL